MEEKLFFQKKNIKYTMKIYNLYKNCSDECTYSFEYLVASFKNRESAEMLILKIELFKEFIIELKKTQQYKDIGTYTFSIDKKSQHVMDLEQVKFDFAAKFAKEKFDLTINADKHHINNEGVVKIKYLLIEQFSKLDDIGDYNIDDLQIIEEELYD